MDLRYSAAVCVPGVQKGRRLYVVAHMMTGRVVVAGIILEVLSCYGRLVVDRRADRRCGLLHSEGAYIYVQRRSLAAWRLLACYRRRAVACSRESVEGAGVARG